MWYDFRANKVYFYLPSLQQFVIIFHFQSTFHASFDCFSPSLFLSLIFQLGVTLWFWQPVDSPLTLPSLRLCLALYLLAKAAFLSCLWLLIWLGLRLHLHLHLHLFLIKFWLTDSHTDRGRHSRTHTHTHTQLLRHLQLCRELLNARLAAEFSRFFVVW